MRVLITGGTGFIGSALVKTLLNRDDRVLILTRQDRVDQSNCRYIQSLDQIENGEAIDAVVNLAGASLAGQRWSRAYKQEIISSRLQTTRHLIGLVQRMRQRPEVLINASAIGYYGHSLHNTFTEASKPTGESFSQQLCQDWEAAANEAIALGLRVCCLRLGVVMDAEGGALRDMSQSFRLGLASWLGSGHQWLSWIHRIDAVQAILYLIERRGLAGAFNITAPGPVTHREFCRALKQHHRTVVTAGVPGLVMRILVGEMADELLLKGQKVEPQALADAGFHFRYPDINSALAAIYHN
ncbi:MAG: TIGR01777 family oxidoreductase [Pseudomonadota bacterium]